MKQVVLGTAGHIDHGKTSLIRALTGIETDRLKEEKARGITIELGFAHMILPSGEQLGIVDVPGHEKFVRHMVAGATGIDLVMLVVAADEGIMPQTREHLEICELLRVKQGLVALTKIDMIDDPEWLDMVTEETADFLTGTFLEGAPIVPVSAVTGAGIEELRKVLTDIVARTDAKSAEGGFRLPVDRVFTMKGFGTVVTGTSISGRIHVGDAVVVYPSEHKSKVRGLQVHNQDVEEAFPGQRTAVNLQGLDRVLISRGDVVASPGAMKPGYMMDAHLSMLSSAPRPLKNRAKIRLHTGTLERIATIVLLDRDELLPGDAAYVQIRMDLPIATLRGDRFVLRSYSPMRAIAGGEVLHPAPRKHKGRDKARMVEALAELDHAEDPEVLLWHLREAGPSGISEAELRVLANVSLKAFDKHLSKLISTREAVVFDKEQKRMVHVAVIDPLRKEILARVGRHHEEFPLMEGVGKEELAGRLSRPVDSRLYNYILRGLAADEQLKQTNEWLSLPGHKPGLKEDEEQLKARLEGLYRDAGLQPPTIKEAAAELDRELGSFKDILKWMTTRSILIKVKEDLYFHHDNITDLQNKLIDYLIENEEIDASGFKDLTRTSRKFAIPLLEYFDGMKITIRVGDARRLRDSVRNSRGAG